MITGYARFWNRKSLSALLFLVFCLTLMSLGGAATDSSQQRQQERAEEREKRARLEESLARLTELAKMRVEDIEVKNETRALDVIDVQKVEDDDGLLRLTFRNNYDKTVTGFKVLVGQVRVGTELSPPHKPFVHPGATLDQTYAIQTELGTRGITVLCVVFDDGSADGNPKHIAAINQERLGANMARKEVLSLIRQTADLRDAERLNKLESLVWQLPTPGSEMSVIAKASLNVERTRIRQEISNLKEQWVKHGRLHINGELGVAVRVAPGVAAATQGRSAHWRNLVEYYERLITLFKAVDVTR